MSIEYTCVFWTTLIVWQLSWTWYSCTKENSGREDPQRRPFSYFE